LLADVSSSLAVFFLLRDLVLGNHGGLDVLSSQDSGDT